MTHPAWTTIRLPLELHPDVVHVIRLQLDRPLERWIPLNEFLTDDERTRAARFHFVEPRQQFIICRAALRQILGSVCDIAPREVPLLTGTNGKPELGFTDLQQTTPGIEFNVSHSGAIGLIAITIGSPVGIDVEQYKSTIESLRLAERFFSPTEAAALLKLPPEKQLAGFYRCWTCKEAYIKATGRGLSLSLSRFQVEVDPDRPASLLHVDEPLDEPARWTTKSLYVGDDYAAAVMVAKPNCQIECWNCRI